MAASLSRAALQVETTTASLGPLVRIAHGSVDHRGHVRYDAPAPERFIEPQVPRYLKEGLEACVRKYRNMRQFGHPKLLDHILDACVQFQVEKNLREAHLVTWRGNVLDLRVQYVAGVLFVAEFDPHPERNQLGQLRSGYHGYAFEALCTSAQGSRINVCLDQWFAVVTRTLGDLNLLFAGEVDSISGESTGDPENFIELKTAGIGASLHKRKWFIQSHLLGVPRICIGYRDKGYVLKSTKMLETDDLVKTDQDWVAAGYEMAYRALKTLREQCAAQAASNTVWRVRVQQGVVGELDVLCADKTDLLTREARIGLLRGDHWAQMQG